MFKTKIILLEKPELKYIKAFFFKNQDLINSIPKIYRRDIADKIIESLDKEDTILLLLPKTTSRYNIIDEINKLEPSLKYILYTPNIIINWVEVGRKENGEPLYHLSRTNPEETKEIELLVNKIKT